MNAPENERDWFPPLLKNNLLLKNNIFNIAIYNDLDTNNVWGKFIYQNNIYKDLSLQIDPYINNFIINDSDKRFMYSIRKIGFSDNNIKLYFTERQDDRVWYYFIDMNEEIIYFCNLRKNEVNNYPITKKPRNPEESYLPQEQENVLIYNNLKLRIDYRKNNHNNTFKINENIILKCEIININNADEIIYLKEHHDYHGTLDYPTSIYITIKNENGEILFDEYTGYIRWSTEFKEMPSDLILLRYNEVLTRYFSINKILGGKRFIDEYNEYLNILSVGKYYVIITLKYCDKNNKTFKKYISNSLELNIIEK